MMMMMMLCVSSVECFERERELAVVDSVSGVCVVTGVDCGLLWTVLWVGRSIFVLFCEESGGFLFVGFFFLFIFYFF